MKSKRVLSLVLAMVMVLGTFGTVFAQDDDSTFGERIDWLRKEGIVVGNEAGELMLDANIDRASVAKMVVEALGQREVAEGMKTYPSSFKDVPVTNWSNGNINVVSARGLMIGNEKAQFMPGSDISYAEVLTILVRMVDGEQVNAVWPTSYIAKAHELGILEGIELPADFMQKAARKPILEMFYNAMINMEVGKYQVVKGIVLENYRVQKLDKNQILVEIIQEIKKADYVTESRDVEGDQVTLTLPADVEGDVEDLLGRVADFTVDRNNNIVKVNVDESYKLETGSMKATKGKMGSYTVELEERYRDRDDTIFRTYYNNEPVAYEDFYRNPDETDRKDDFTVDYAKVTVKNGKVLFIDAFNFEDIAPVKEVKNDGAEVNVYNDIRDGAIKKINLSASDVVITFNDGTLGLGSKEDIRINDVVHQYDGGLIVRQDAVVNGEFDKVSESSNTIYVHVDDAKFEILEEDYKRPVYEYETEDDFYTLYARNADSVLREFRGEKVTVLKDIAGNLQYIGSEIELGEFVGLVTRVVGDQLRVLKSDGKTSDYRANLDTRVYVNGTTTGHRGLNALTEGDLVYVSSDEEVLDRIDKLTEGSLTVNDLTTREIDLDDARAAYRILGETNVFVSMPGQDELSVRKLSDVISAYDKDIKVVKAYVVDGKEFIDLRVRRPEANITRDTEAHTIVFTQLDIKADVKTNIVEFKGFTDRQEREMDITLQDDTKDTRFINRNVVYHDLDGKDVVLRNGDIIEINQTDDEDKDITKVTRLIEKATQGRENVFRVKDYDSRGNLLVEDRYGKEATYFVDSKTAQFGGNIARNEGISFVLEDNGRYVKALLTRGKIRDNDVTGIIPGSTAPVDTGIVTYIDDAGNLIVGDVDYTIGATTVLKNEKGTVIAVGKAAIDTALAQNDEVKSIDVVNGVVKSLVGVSVASETLAAKATVDFIAAFTTPDATQSEVDSARGAYDLLTLSQKDLVDYAKLVAEENKLAKADAETLVHALFVDHEVTPLVLAGGVDQDAIDAAQDAVDEVAAADKAALQTLVDAAQALFNLNEAETLVHALFVDHEVTPLVLAGGVDQDAIDAAQDAVDEVAAADKAALQTLVDAAQDLLEEANALTDLTAAKDSTLKMRTYLEKYAEVLDIDVTDAKYVANKDTVANEVITANPATLANVKTAFDAALALLP